MKKTLTPRQKQLLAYLKANRENPPSYREIAFALDFASAGNVADMVARIVKRGWMHSPERRARCYSFVED